MLIYVLIVLGVIALLITWGWWRLRRNSALSEASTFVRGWRPGSFDDPWS